MLCKSALKHSVTMFHSQNQGANLKLIQSRKDEGKNIFNVEFFVKSIVFL